MEYTRKISYFLLLACPLALSIIAQAWHQSLIQGKRDYAKIFSLPLPSTHLVNFASLGFKNLIADFLWLEAIQSFAAWDYKGSRFPQRFDLITSLDPRFEYPYLFSIFVLSSEGYLDFTKTLADRGMKALPDNWRIPLYLGTQIKLIARDNETSLRYLSLASEKPGRPKAIEATKAAILARKGDTETARILFLTILDTANNQYTREQAERWLMWLDAMGKVEKAVDVYLARFGELPESLSNLTERGVLAGGENLRDVPIVVTPDGKVRFREREN